jgi:hypothetical protein
VLPLYVPVPKNREWGRKSWHNMDPNFRDQLTGALRIIVPWLLTLAVSQGWLPIEKVGDIAKYSIDVIVGIVTVGAIVWSWYSHRQINQIANVANMDSVKKVVTTKQIAKVALKDDPKVVSQ